MSHYDSVLYRERELGRKFDIDSHYYNWTDNFPSRLEYADVAAGRIPEITWWGTKYSSILDGSYDVMIRARALAVKAFGHPLFLRWAAEMNGYWFPWGGPQNNNDPAAFVAAWRHIHDIFRAEGVTNVAWVWAPASESNPGYTDLTSWNNWRHYYPGDAYVDWVGIDGYNWGNYYHGIDEWQSLGQIMSPIYRDYAGRKPIMIAETSSVESGGSKSEWITQARGWIEHHPGIKALVFFDKTYPNLNWAIDSSQSSFEAFAALATDPYFARKVGPSEIFAATIRSFEPVRGVPGTTVTLRGSRFARVTSVRFGGVAAKAFAIHGDGKLTVVVPHGGRTGKIVVKSPGGVGMTSRAFVVRR